MRKEIQKIVIDALTTGPVASQDLYSHVRSEGYNVHPQTIRSYTENLGIKRKKVGFMGKTYWGLTESDLAKIVVQPKKTTTSVPEKAVKKAARTYPLGLKRGKVLADHNKKVNDLLLSGKADTLDQCAVVLGDCTGRALHARNDKNGTFKKALQVVAARKVKKAGIIARIKFLFTGK